MKKMMYCFICNEDVEVKIIKKNNTYNVRGMNVNIEEETYFCPKCNNELYDNSMDNTLYQIYNKYLNSFDLSFDIFKEIRNTYNLSQDLFAKALGWSKISIIRYENADTLPQKQCLLTYQKIKNNKNEFINILKSNKDLIDNNTY